MVKTRSIIAGVMTAGLVALTPLTAALATDQGNSNAQEKVTICHATGSTTNPYVVITPDANGVVNGHYDHQDSRDIIPQFTYNDHGTTKTFPGQNWDANGQAIYNNGCVLASTDIGGRGGGSGGSTSTQQTGGAGGGSATGQVSQVPAGGADTGGGGINAFSLTSLARPW